MKSSGAPALYVPRAWSAVQVGTPAGVGETVLKSFTIPADTFGANGTRIKARYWGAFGANANTKNLRIRLGPVTLAGTILLATGAVAFNGSDFDITIEIVRRVSGGQNAIAVFLEDAAVAANIVDIQQVGAGNADTAAMLLELTGQNGAAVANDIMANGHFIDWIAPS